ncbi:MAG: DUF5329 family protein [Candidatus Electrothrix aestuarii]|uniref:DUF5329 family protein n=1 Tax=Candidatus Electrothrix aestuarii TaxID=3062594 RepID=A0AAU8LXA6_9BACT|nr:DUF5329 family protein [Candidatus Electrothrix aestuarii]WPD22449.1 MAG: DUF5329 family protein [Candidatus Electrothrix sp. GW3-3]
MPFFLIFILLITGTAHADVPAAQQAEVEHLLSFVQTSTCLIDRNGSSHTGEEAAAHIKKKYDYFSNKIKTTEQFIEYSATKSTMSGSYYTVRCDGQEPIRTRDWLLRELKAYRRSRSR